MKSWNDRYWTSLDGLKLHFRDYDGPADRPPVLCLHGLTRNARDFESLADRISGDWRVIVPDFRGRGMSDYDPHPAQYLPPTYAADVLQLLDELEIGEAVFIGTSLGGLVTMIAAGFAPQRIAGALLNDVGPELTDAGLDRIREYVGKPRLFSSWDDAARQFAAEYSDRHPGYGHRQWVTFAKRVCRETDRGVEFDYDMAIAEPFKHLDEGATSAPDIWPLYRALAGRPLVILRGKQSDLFAPEIAEKMAKMVPAAELVTVPNVGHAPDFDEPESIAAVDRLLERVLRR